MRKLVFDIEANGLYPSVIHCIVAKDIETDEVFTWTPKEVGKFRAWVINNASLLIGHNIIGYDLPTLKRLCDIDWPLSKTVDTLVISRLLHSDRRRHGLESWGEDLGYAKVEHEDWSKFSPEVLNRCTVDVHLNHKVYDRLVKDAGEQALPKDVARQEHLIAQMCQDIYAHGWILDERKAFRLQAELMSRSAELEKELNSIFVPLPKKDGKLVEPKYKKDGSLSTVGLKHLEGHWVDVEGSHSKVEWQGTSYTSKPFLIRHLKMLGWSPTKFTESGQAELSESILATIDLPEAAPLIEWDMIRRRLAMIQSWTLAIGAMHWTGKGNNKKPINLIKGDNRVHGSIRHIGTWTQRPAHNDPNMAQVPSCGKPYGAECRDLWSTPRGYKLVGCDASGIQLRVLAHYIGDPAYSAEVVDGDIHTVHLEALGMGNRDNAKTFIYAFLLGAGGGVIGGIYNKSANEGHKLKAQFLDRIPALKDMKNKYEIAAESGYIIGLDKRRIPVEDPYYTMAALLQGGETVIMRRAMKLWHERAKHIDYHLLGWIHDEWQSEVREDQAEEFGQIQRQSIIDAGIQLRLRCPMDGEYKIGKTWKETH